MGKQWVDITTIDNNTPFMKVRWRKYFANQNRNYWFSELPGLETDEMSWRDGTKEYGWFSAHRTNGGTQGVFYSASFNFDHTASGYWNEAGKNYRVSLQDGDRDQYYDTAVTINGETYYEVDFSLWSGASEYKLYSPYATTPYGAGDIYVEIDTGSIVVDKDSLSFKSSGETQNVVVASDNPWTATTSEAWVTLSTSAGTSGETTLSVTAPEYTSTTEDRTATITITDGEFSVTINVKQKKYSVGVSEMYLGTLNMEAAYFGGLEVEAIYLGENEVYSSGPFSGLRVSPTAQTIDDTGGTFNLKVKSTEDWTLTMDPTYLSADAYSGTTGETIVTVTVADNTGNTDIETTITATSANFTAESTVTILRLIPGVTIKYHVNDSKEITFTGISNTLISSSFDPVTGWGERKYEPGLTVFPKYGLKRGGLWSGYAAITDIEFGEGFERITDTSLSSCANLSGITLPSTIKTLEIHWKFSGYTVNQLTIKATTPPNAGSAFADGGWASTGTLYVPSESISAYQAWLPSQISGWTVTAIV